MVFVARKSSYLWVKIQMLVPLIGHGIINCSGVGIILRDQTNLPEVKWSVACNFIGGHDWEGAAN